MSEEANAPLESLSDEELQRLAAELRRTFPGIGYYGPTKSGEDRATHLDNKLCSTKEEALELYRKYWFRKAPGFCCGEEMTEEDVDLCYWKDGWGPLFVPDPTQWVEQAQELEDWFLSYYHGFQVTMKKYEEQVVCWVDREDGNGLWSTSQGSPKDEARVRAVALLKVLKALRDSEY